MLCKKIYVFFFFPDGRKPYPINHGPSSSETFVQDAARVCQEYMNRDPDEVRFTMIALVAED